jgi:tetratricopeptide (TPR) repeat protein
MNGLPWIVAVAAVTDKYADRQHSVMSRAHYLFGWGFVAVCVALLLGANRTASGGASAGAGYGPSDAGGAGAEEIWWRRVRPYCNAVEVRVVQRESAPPATTRGAGYHAACFALAGQIDEARRIIDALAPNERYRAAEIVFEVGHPVADAGDDRSAAPIMELVIDYWPNHYMALYHAGMSDYVLGNRERARTHLDEFLKLYAVEDGFRRAAKDALVKLR